MATLKESTERPESHGKGRVRHPLERLGRTIRLYVAIETLAVLVIFLSVCFWIGLFFDYGFFKAFGVDWVQELPTWLRQFLRMAFALGLAFLVVRAVIRVARRFRSDALALVLERRFPDLLGDRLITAVELADSAAAERLGYSRLMVEQTIQEAVERVDRLPIDQAFDWRRLRRLIGRALLLTVGVFAVVAGCYIAWSRMPLGEYLVRFRNVAVIWYERNILLWNTIWPRQAHLELVGFPEGGELRIGRDSPPPALRYRATHWLVADHKAFEGWRPLAWHDVKPSLVGAAVTIPELPPAWRDWTVDHIELELDKQQDALPAQTHLDLRNLLEKLEELAARPDMARRLRQLRPPDQITVYYRGDSMRSEQTFQRQAEHEYTGTLSDLKESVRFTAKARDYYTPYQLITVVPPPSLIQLRRDEEQPAYLYHRLPAREKPAGLRGKKQLIHDVPISLSGTISRIDLPAGSNIVLKGESDKPLTPPGGSKLAPGPGIRLRPRESSKPFKHVVEQVGERAFTIRIDQLAEPIDFDIQLVDTDNVSGARHVVIKPNEDTPPDVDVVLEVLRKTNQGYLASPVAKIPISGKIRDDHGLAQVQYRYTLAPLDLPANMLAGPLMLPLGSTQPSVGFDLASLGYLAYAAAIARSATDDSSRRPTVAELATFTRRLRESEPEPVPLAQVEKLLSTMPERKLLRELSLDPDEEFFDLLPLRLKVSDERAGQPRYRLRLDVAAIDNNIETGPGVGTCKERFTVNIVSENELLSVIAEEEESLQVKFKDALDRTKESRAKLDRVLQELPTLKPEEFSPMARRAEELQEALVKSWDVCQEVHRDYRKILKELQVNRVDAKIVERVQRSICEPLESVLGQEFVRTDESLKGFQKLLEEKKGDPKAGTQTRQEFDRLIDKLQRILDAMGELMNINKLIEMLVKMEQEEMNSYKRFQQINLKLQQDILDSVTNPPAKSEKKP